MIPIIENENFINGISINELPYQESIRLIKELEYFNKLQIAEQIMFLANEVRYSKNNKYLKFAIDFEHLLQHRFSKYLEKDHFKKMYDQFIENGDWSLISNEFFNYNV